MSFVTREIRIEYVSELQTFRIRNSKYLQRAINKNSH